MFFSSFIVGDSLLFCPCCSSCLQRPCKVIFSLVHVPGSKCLHGVLYLMLFTQVKQKAGIQNQIFDIIEIRQRTIFSFLQRH
jgi:hypothetical protein